MKNTRADRHYVSKDAKIKVDVLNRKAILTEEVSFFTSSSSRQQKDKTIYKAGTEVIGRYRMAITDLFIFTFPNGVEFMIRPHKFKWLDEIEK